jgi:hypothetical protein
MLLVEAGYNEGSRCGIFGCRARGCSRCSRVRWYRDFLADRTAYEQSESYGGRDDTGGYSRSLIRAEPFANRKPICSGKRVTNSDAHADVDAERGHGRKYELHCANCTRRHLYEH